MNIIGWLLHLAVLAWCWPLIRHWWNGDASLGHEGGVPYGRKRWAVWASFLLPIVSWFWLVPCATGQRWREQERRDVAQRVRERAQRERDVAFWREQAATGDLVSAWIGVELLAMWGAPLVKPERPAEDIVPTMVAFVGGEVVALPGAPEYSHDCGCRNCGRARRAIPSGLLSQPPTLLRLTQAEMDLLFRGSLDHATPPRIFKPGGPVPCRCGATACCEMCASCRGEWEQEIHL